MVTAGWGGRRTGAGGPRKLAEWQVEEMVSMRRGGAPVTKLASFYGISERTVRRYLNEEKRRCG